MVQGRMILFVCEHGAAKSGIAASYFNKLCTQKGLAWHAVARGTNPEKTISQQALTGLLEDGLTPTSTVPQKISAADVESAQRIITFCELPPEYQHSGFIERWADVPPVSDGYIQARDAIIAHLRQLLSNL